MDFFLSGFLFPRNSVLESWTVANPFLFGIHVFSRGCVSFRTCLLESTDLLPSRTRPWLQQSQRLVQVVFHEKRNASHELSVPGLGPPHFFVCGSLAIYIFEQYLECTETAMALAALTAEADGNTKLSRISSLGRFFIAY